MYTCFAEKTLFYDEILKRKEDFLNSNLLYRQFNKIVNQGGKK